MSAAPSASTDEAIDEIVELAALAVRRDGSALTVDDASIARVEARLATHLETDALPDIVLELALFAVFLKTEKGAQDACDALLRVCESAAPALERLGDEGKRLAEGVRAAAATRDYSRITGNERSVAVERRAPREGEVAAGPLARFRLKGDAPR